MKRTDKPLIWLEGEIKTPPFSHEARIEAGFLLRRLQIGEKIEMPQSRPMPDIAKGCHELRVTDKNADWRIIYAIEPDCLVILDVFAKKSKKTPKNIIVACRERITAFREILKENENE
jgi:phage-related protein